MTIFVDVHEPEEIKQIADEVKNLGFDYWIVGTEREFVVERKSLVDLIGSMRSKSKVKDRFYEQMFRIIEFANERRKEGIDAYAVVILEGDHFKRYRARFAKMSPEQWMGIQSRLVENNVGMIRTWSLNETKLALQILNKRAGKNKAVINEIGFKKEYRTIDDEAMHMIMAVRGIGTKNVIKLFDVFGSVKNIINSTEKELEFVLGERLAKHLIEVVNKEVKRSDGNERLQ